MASHGLIEHRQGVFPIRQVPNRVRRNQMASPGSSKVSLTTGKLLNGYRPVDSDVGEGPGVLELSSRDSVDSPRGPGSRSVLGGILGLQSIDHVLNTLIVADVIRIAIVDDGTNTGVDNLFKVRTGGPHPVSFLPRNTLASGRGVHTVITRTGQVKVVIDGEIGFTPSRFGADFGCLVVQPVGNVCGVTRGVFGEDVVDVPLADKGRKDIVVADILSQTAIVVSSATSALEDLVPG